MLTVILEHKMPEDQALAFRVLCWYLGMAKKIFPSYKHYRIPKGDPRKSSLFSYCLKLVRETQDKLLPHEYKLYVAAQFMTLSAVRTSDNVHPLIKPSCLVGERAWTRWQLWYAKYKKSRAFANKKTDDIPINTILRDLERTKQFLLVRLDDRGVSTILADGTLFRWVNLGRVSGYYVALSPVVQKWLSNNPVDLMAEYSFDLNLYPVSSELQVGFQKMFASEF